MEDKLIEDLAKLEHDQWVAWSKDIAKTEDITKGRTDRWKKLWCPYGKLSEDDKDKDREWARKALNIMKKHMNQQTMQVKKKHKKACISEVLSHVARMLSPENSKMQAWLKDVATNDIKPEDATAIYKAYDKGADTEHSVAKVTGIDSWTCKKVLDMAMKHGILDQGK